MMRFHGVLKGFTRFSVQALLFSLAAVEGLRADLESGSFQVRNDLDFGWQAYSVDDQGDVVNATDRLEVSDDAESNQEQLVWKSGFGGAEQTRVTRRFPPTVGDRAQATFRFRPGSSDVEGMLYFEQKDGDAIGIQFLQGTVRITNPGNANPIDTGVRFEPEGWNSFVLQIDFVAHAMNVILNGNSIGTYQISSNLSHIDQLNFYAGGVGFSSALAGVSVVSIDQFREVPPAQNEAKQLGGNGANLAPNAGFEMPSFSGYADNGRNVLDRNNPHTGDVSARQPAVAGESWNTLQMSEMIPVQEGMLYRLSVFGRNTLTDGELFVGLREVNVSGDTLRFHWEPIGIGQTDWKENSFEIRPGVGAKSLQIYFRISPESTAGSAWWDTVRLTASPDPLFVRRPPPIQFDQMDTLVLARKGNEPLQKELPLRLRVHPDGHGGTVKLALFPKNASGIVNESALWEQDFKLENPGPLELKVPVESLKAGRYDLKVSFLGADLLTEMSFRKPLEVIVPDQYPSLVPIKRTEIGKDGFLLVNGKPFLSVYYYHNPLSLDELTELKERYGATTAQVWGNDSIDALCKSVDDAWKAGLYSWAVLFHPAMYDIKAGKWKDAKLIEAVNRLKNHPGLIGWDLLDEPDVAEPNVPTEEVRRAFDIVRKLDPDHVIWVNFCKIDKFQKYAGTSDIASYDHYPLPLQGLDKITEHNVAIQKAFPGKPLLSCLQTFAYPGTNMPSPAQLRAQVYLNLCEGMALYHYYSWFEPESFEALHNMPEQRSYTKFLNHELHALQPFMFSREIVSATVSGHDASKLRFAVRRVGESIVIVVVNMDPSPVSDWRLVVDNQSLASVESFFYPDEKIAIRDGAISEKLPGYGVGIYRAH